MLDFFTDLRAELNGRAKHAKGDVKRLNLVVRDYFQRVELSHEGAGVRVVPVLSWATVERIAATGNHLSNSLVFKRAVLSRPQPVIALGEEQIVPPLRAIRAIHNPQPPS